MDKLIDISHPLEENTPVYPGDSPLTLTLRKSLGVDGYCAYTLNTGLHAGTHVDVPMHLLDDGRWIGGFPPDRFAGEGVLLDVRGEDIIAMKSCYESEVAEGAVALLYTGWDTRYGSEKYFTDHPMLSAELCDFLIARKILMLGMDTPSPDRMPFAVHKTLLSGGVMLLENLTNLGALVGIARFEVFALPLKLRAEASPVRAVCRAVGGGAPHSAAFTANEVREYGSSGVREFDGGKF